MDKKTEALKLIDLLVKQDILTKHETNLLREALAQSRSDEEQQAQQDSTCNKKLREQGKAYPRTCKKCGLGPCIADRVQPAPVAQVRSTEEALSTERALKLALEAAYLAGFNASGEGYNGEYPFQDHDAHPEQDEHWRKGRDYYVREALAEQPAQQDMPKIGCVNHDCDKCKAQQQEPVTWGVDWGKAGETPCATIIQRTSNGGIKVLAVEYGPPASKPWVGLTVDELESGSQIEKAKSGAAIDLSTAFWAGARWAEAKLREKNNG